MSEDVAALCDQLEQLRAAATAPTPWSLDPDLAGGADPVDVDGEFVADRLGNLGYDNAALIVASVNAAPTLIAAARERDRLRGAVAGLAEELEAPVFRAAIYEGEIVQGRHEGEDAERRRVAARLRAVLSEALPGGEK